MSDLHHTGRRSVLAGIGAAALAASFNPPLVRAQALDRPPSVLIFDVTESLLDLQALRPLFQPQYVGKDLSAVADQIIARNGPGHR
jgi:hypothetical protein